MLILCFVLSNNGIGIGIGIEGAEFDRIGAGVCAAGVIRELLQIDAEDFGAEKSAGRGCELGKN